MSFFNIIDFFSKPSSCGNSYNYLIFIVILSFIQLSHEDNFMMTKPDYLQSCQFSDPEFVKCSTKSVQQLVGKIINGIEGLDTLPSVDPLKINKVRIFQGSGPVSINSSLTKITIAGFSNTKVKESKVDSKTFSWETHFLFPKMRLDGFYEVKGRILIIPLHGHGKIWIEATNMDVVMYTKTKLYEKFNHVFYNVTETKIDYNITGLKLHLDNLFDGLKTLEDGTNQYINNNWRPASDALKPVIKKTVEDILLNLLQEVFHYVPADYLVSDIPRPSELKKSKIKN